MPDTLRPPTAPFTKPGPSGPEPAPPTITPPTPTTTTTTSTSTLTANLARLRRIDPDLADLIARTPPAPLAFAPSRSGPTTASISHDGQPLTLASRYDPAREAEQLAKPLEPARHAAAFVVGLGLGYHVAEVVRRLGGESVVVVYEPDPALLRATLEHIDCSAWIGLPHVILHVGPTDLAALIRRVEPHASRVTQGSAFVVHPPTRQRSPHDCDAFSKAVTDLVAFCRTHVATALVNAARTIENFCFNLAHYVAGHDCNELHHAALGIPAVCVSAGPSLARNVHLLRDPAVRARVIVIAAQTVLRPLLDRGITPDFVTALDYHEISRRFYENLDHLPRTTLVAEPLAHHSILESFPGPVRLTQSAFLDRLLGPLARRRPRIPIPYGATVAHLSVYLARHLGCDPVILIGQDLAFSDGLYYCPGTAIHDVWASELGPFNTLEMMEWQRIVRHRSHLQKLTDVHGRPCYSDEQMLTYLRQFERDFAAHAAAPAGRTVTPADATGSHPPTTYIDATEGGIAKQGAARMSLRRALDDHAHRPAPTLPLPPLGLDPQRIAAAIDQIGRRITQTREIKSLAERATPILQQMIEHQRNYPRMQELFARLEKLKRRVGELQEVFDLLNELNTVGSFNRARQDRAIEHAPADADQPGRSAESLQQESRLRRDLENMRWLVQACDEAQRIFAAASVRLGQHQPSL